MTNILQNYPFVKQKPNQIIDFPRSNVYQSNTGLISRSSRNATLGFYSKLIGRRKCCKIVASVANPQSAKLGRYTESQI
jgi:hypothetical protein